MPTYSEKNLKKVWDLVKGGAKKKEVVEFFKCTEKAATDLYHQASLKYGKGPRLQERICDNVKEPEERPVSRFERPQASYSAGYLNILNSYEQ